MSDFLHVPAGSAFADVIIKNKDVLLDCEPVAGEDLKIGRHTAETIYGLGVVTLLPDDPFLFELLRFLHNTTADPKPRVWYRAIYKTVGISEEHLVSIDLRCVRFEWGHLSPFSFDASAHTHVWFRFVFIDGRVLIQLRNIGDEKPFTELAPYECFSPKAAEIAERIQRAATVICRSVRRWWFLEPNARGGERSYADDLSHAARRARVNANAELGIDDADAPPTNANEDDVERS